MSTPATPEKKRPTQSRIELPPDELAEIRAVAKSIGLKLSTFVRMAAVKEAKRIKSRSG